jgi:hypothetical protein
MTETTIMADDNDDRNHAQRRCSDKECAEARKDWLDTVVWPRLKIQMAVLIGSTVIFCSGVFMMLSKSNITEHELADTRTYVTIPQHGADITRIETQIADLKVEFKSSRDEILDKLDRNYDALRVKKP